MGADTPELTDTVEARFWDGPTSVEPRPDEPMWRKAAPVFFAHDWDGNLSQGHATTVRAVWTLDTLWLLFSCAYEKLTISPHARADTETNRLWEISDVAEAFIAPNPADILHYKEFQVSPAGEWVDLAIDRVNIKHDWTWNSGFRAAARVDAAGATWWALMAIPLGAFGVERPAADVRWRVNFFRMEQGPPQRLIAWQPPHQPNFHTPQAFGWLVFKEN